MKPLDRVFSPIPRERTAHFISFPILHNVLLYHGHNNKTLGPILVKHHFSGIPCYRDKGFTPHNPAQDQFCAWHILLGYITKEQGKQKHKLP